MRSCPTLTNLPMLAIRRPVPASVAGDSHAPGSADGSLVSGYPNVPHRRAWWSATTAAAGPAPGWKLTPTLRTPSRCRAEARTTTFFYRRAGDAQVLVARAGGQPLATYDGHLPSATLVAGQVAWNGMALDMGLVRERALSGAGREPAIRILMVARELLPLPGRACACPQRAILATMQCGSFGRRR